MSKRFVFKPRTPDTLAPAAGQTRTEYLDAGHRGRGSLAFRVTSSGARAWSLLYRFPGGRAGKTRRLPLGNFPAVGLAKAREDAENAAKMLPVRDPGARHSVVRQASTQGLTWQLLRTTWLAAKQPLWSHRTYINYSSQSAVLVAGLEAQGAVLVPQTTVQQVQDVLLTHGTTVYSNRLRGRFLNLQEYARAHSWITDLIVQNPSKELEWHDEKKLGRKNKQRGPNGEPAKLRAYTVPEMNELLRIFAKQPAALRPFCDLYETLLYTGTRKVEAAGMRWDELDLDKGLWTISPERIKTEDDGTPLIVVLIPRLVTLLRRRAAFTDRWLAGEGMSAATRSYRRRRAPEKTYVFWAKTPARSVHHRADDVAEAVSVALSFKLECHNLRRTFATRYEEAGASEVAPTSRQL